MFKKVILIGLFTAALMFQGTALWADDDAIMDVDDNAASFVGSWPTSTNRILYYGDDYQYAAGSGSGTQTHIATFTTAQTADITGEYHVYVRWTAGTARGTSVYYRIYDDLNNYKGYCIKDQRYNGGAWQYCNTVTLNSGRRGVVKLGNENEPTNRYICADAVRFVRQSWDSNNFVGVDLRQAGVDYSSRSSLNYTSISTSSSSRTNLKSVAISPSAWGGSGGYGYVVVRASGWVYNYNANTSLYLCIDDASGGSTCDSYTHQYWDNDTYEYQDFSIQERYYVSGTSTKYFYLKGYRSSTATGVLYMDDLIVEFFPKSY